MAIFDLDGTLVDSFGLFVGIYNSLTERYRIQSLDHGQAERMRQLSPREIMSSIGLPCWQLPRLARDFTRLMRQRRQEAPLFPDVGRVLHELYAQGLRLAVVSSNSKEYCHDTLGEDVCALMGRIEGGASLFGKHHRIRRVLSKLGVRPDRAIYVGDQLTDAEAARKAGVAFGAVGWGYGVPEALARQRPDVMFERIHDLRVLVVETD